MLTLINIKNTGRRKNLRFEVLQSGVFTKYFFRQNDGLYRILDLVMNPYLKVFTYNNLIPWLSFFRFSFLLTPTLNLGLLLLPLGSRGLTVIHTQEYVD